MEKQIDTDPVFFFEQQINFIYKCEKQGKSPNTLKNYKTDLNCFNNFLKDNNWEPSKKSLSNSLIRHYAHFLDKKYSSDNSYLVTGGPVSGAYYGGLAGLGISAYQMSKLLKEHGPKVKKNILMGLGVGGLAGLLELLSKRKRDR